MPQKQPTFPKDYNLGADGVYTPKRGRAATSIDYTDGIEAEKRLYSIVAAAKDKSILSLDLNSHTKDFVSSYHLSAKRANLLRPLSHLLRGRVLEAGAGCGAVSRFLGEIGAELVALEGSRTRARIARTRTLDQPNVSVVCGRIETFSASEPFDAIVVIGILEYARKYIQEKDPELLFLSRLRQLLKPNGILVLAIENQLGLKYFAGALEDHYSQEFFGINDSYPPGGVATFGREELRRLLNEAGFGNQLSFSPCPDYKFPTSIISVDNLSTEEKIATELLQQSATFDPQMPTNPTFSLERAWAVVERNSMLGSVSNSFLLLAGDACLEHFASFKNKVAWHYSVDRHAAFSKETTFEKKEDKLVITRNSLSSEELPDVPIEWDFGDQQFIDGRNWWSELVKVVNIIGWSVRDLVEWADVWISALAKVAEIEPLPENLKSKVNGKCFDLMPFNLIRTKSDVSVFFDQEWRIKRPLEFGYLVFRGLRDGIGRITSCARPAEGTPIALNILVMKVMSEFGYAISREDVDRFMTFELQVQKWVRGDVTEGVDQGIVDQLWLHLLKVRSHPDGRALALQRDDALTELASARTSLLEGARALGESQELASQWGGENQSLRSQLSDQARLATQRLAQMDGENQSLRSQLSDQARLATQRLAQMDALAAENENLGLQLAEGKAEIERRTLEAQAMDSERRQLSCLAEERLGQMGELRNAYQAVEAQLNESDRRLYNLTSRLHAGWDARQTGPTAEGPSSQFQNLVDRLSSEPASVLHYVTGGNKPSASHASTIAECLAYMAEADRKIYELSAALEAKRQDN